MEKENFNTKTPESEEDEVLLLISKYPDSPTEQTKTELISSEMVKKKK